jgi:hypothetical protein
MKQERFLPMKKVLVGLTFFLLALSTGPLFAAGVININQHKVDTSVHQESCPQTRPEPPYQEAFGSAEINVMAYHAFPYLDTGPNPPVYRDWPFYTARCYANQERPRIINDDAGFAETSLADSPQTYIRKTCDFSTTWPKGHSHFEHFDQYLDFKMKHGDTIDDEGDWPVEALAMAQWIDSDPDVDCNDVLEPNGELSAAGKLLTWNNDPITLIGFGSTGTLTAGDRLAIVPFFRTLRKYGINFTRTWSLEQWAGQAVCRVDPVAEGVTPFAGTLQSDYDLETPNPAFYKRLRTFAQAAADRGVVVQLSLFDKHGLNKPACPGRWLHSPFNSANNEQDWLPDPPGCGAACNTCVQPPEVGEEEEPLACLPSPEFITDQNIDGVNRAFLRRVAKETGGLGNMIFEVMNEALETDDWATDCSCPPEQHPSCTCAGEIWQINMAEALAQELPVFVARDAFNAESQGRVLSNKPPDAGLPTGKWTASNAAVTVEEDDDTRILMGYARGRGYGPEMRGALDLDTSLQWTELGVRAHLSRKGNNMELGFSAGPNPTGNIVRVALGTPLILGTCTRIAIEKRTGTGTPQVLASNCIEINDRDEIRFALDVTSRRGTVYLNGAEVPALADIYIGSSLPNGLSHAYFRGSKSQAGENYTSTDGEVDNFEAVVY